MTEERELLRHFVAALAYRTQKALRGAPESFGDFRVAEGVRTPRELLRHMTSVLGYARTFWNGGTYRAELLESLSAEVKRFHRILEELSDELGRVESLGETTDARLLQGPLADAMTHAGQLAMLRRLSGSPVPPENFIVADIQPRNVSQDQPEPGSPDHEWRAAEDESR